MNTNTVISKNYFYVTGPLVLFLSFIKVSVRCG